MITESRPDVDAALDHAARHLGVTLAGERRHGWGRKSSGCEAVLADGSVAWLRAGYADPSVVDIHVWSGPLEAPQIPGINRPAVLRHYDWVDAGLIWRALLMRRACSAASTTPDLKTALPVTAQWLGNLRRSLVALAGVSTPRVTVKPRLVDYRINQIFGPGIDGRVERWMVSHGDLHWANVGWPDPIILDWEHWGRAPAGMDAAALMVLAGHQPKVAAAVAETFADLLRTRDGLIATLYVCADLIDMMQRYDHPCPDLRPWVEEVGRRTLAALRG